MKRSSSGHLYYSCRFLLTSSEKFPQPDNFAIHLLYCIQCLKIHEKKNLGTTICTVIFEIDPGIKNKKKDDLKTERLIDVNTTFL